MKVTTVNTNKKKFQPYSKTIEIKVEPEEDEFLLNKLKSNAHTEGSLFLSDDKGERLDIKLGYTYEQDEKATELVNEILKNL